MTPGAVAGPLSAVLAALEGGAGSLAEVGDRTGLSPDVVRACIEHLGRLGRLDVRELSAGCPGGGCGSCASSASDGTPGCGSPAPSAARRGPVVVTIGLRRP